MIGDDGIITNSQKAKINAEEAELWEKIQMVLVEGMGQDLDRENYVEEVNNKFKNQGLEAKIGLRADGYAVTYGKYSRKVALLSDDLQILGEIVAIEGNSEDWKFTTKDDGTLMLTEYNKDKVGEIQIPNIIDGKFVTEIGAIFLNTDITSVNIPEGIELIDRNAFFGCSKLNCKIVFPSSLKEIGESAFNGCVGIVGDLNSIVEQGIITGKNAFAKCGNMTGDINVLIKTLDDGVTAIEDNQFSGFSGVTGTLTIPARITSIGANAFSKCSGLTAVEFEEESELESMGESVFAGCSGICQKIILPDSLTTISVRAFENCSNLPGMGFGSELTTICDYAFSGCSSLGGELELPSGVSSIGSYSFQNTGNLDVFLKDGNDSVKLIFRNGAFYRSKIERITFPSKSVEIGSSVFYYCANLEMVEKSDNITVLGQNSFSSTKLLEINLNSLISLGDDVFENCTNLKEIPEMDSLKSIGNGSFRGCKQLSANIIDYLKNSTIETVGDYAFENCSNLTGDFVGLINNKNDKKIELGNTVFAGTQVIRAQEISLNESEELNLESSEIVSNQFAGVTKFLASDNSAKEITEIKIPKNVTKIGSNAFAGCTSLTKIVIPNSVVELGRGVFDGCRKLREIILPNNDKVKEITGYCFNGCSDLKTINLPENINLLGEHCFENCGLISIDLSNIETLSEYCLASCDYLDTITKLNENLTALPKACFFSSGLKNITIPDSVTDIGQFVFQYCHRLTEINVGSGVTKVPRNFCGYSKLLETVTFRGNVTDIDELSFNDCPCLSGVNLTWPLLKRIGKDAFRNCSSLMGTITLSNECVYGGDTTFQGCGLTIRGGAPSDY